MGTVLDTIIAPALRKIGVLGAGEIGASEDTADALSALNNMLDQLAIERLAIWHLERTTFTITSGQQFYTLGVSAANELNNSDFENGSYTPTGGSQVIPVGWSGTGPGTIALVTTPVHAGTYAVSFAPTGGPTNETYIAQRATATINQAWSVSLWGYRQGATGRVYVYNPDSGKYLQSGGTWSTSANPFLTSIGSSGSYSQTTGTFTTESSNVTQLELRVVGRGSAGDFVYFDDVSFGPTYNANMVRPQYIDHVNYQDTDLDPVQEYPMQPLTDDAWAAIPQKDLTNTIPTSWYYNPSYPNGTIYLWPVPTSTSLEGVIYAPTAITQFSTLTQNVSLPPGYPRMLVSNLALELCPDYQITPHPALIDQARDSKAAVKRANHRAMDMSFDGGALVQGSTSLTYDIRVGP